MAIAIQIENLTRYYGNHRAVDQINLEVPEGGIFAFLGPNGAGKTTTIRILMGLLKSSSGNARIFGKQCWSQSKLIKQEVGYICGDLSLYPWLSGNELIRICGLARGTSVKAHARHLAEYFELDLATKVRRMSRGMKQKLGLITTMAHQPRLLILDEPSTGLDPLVQEKLRDKLNELASQGTTIFFSSHSLTEVEQLCQRVAIIRSGRIVADESLENLRKQAGHQIEIRWQSETSCKAQNPPEFLEVIKSSQDYWSCLTLDPIQKSLQWLADKPIKDVSINRPDLETVFRQYYQSQS